MYTFADEEAEAWGEEVADQGFEPGFNYFKA